MSELSSSLRCAIALAATLTCGLAHAQGVASERELETITVSASRTALDPKLPSSSFSITTQDLDRLPMINTQDALNFAPSTHVRKLRVGDTNGGMAGRSFAAGQPQRQLVYVDGLLISNLLASHQVPRWSMVDPAEIARIDVLYGPFSAIYPGNSIGTTVAITTRVPDAFESSVTLSGYRQQQDNYGYDQDFDGHQASAYLAHRRGRLWGSVVANQTRANHHGSGYAVVAPSTTSNGGTPVSGAVADEDIKGQPRWVLGNTSLADTSQELVKLRLGYDFVASLELDVTAAWFRSDGDGSADTFLRDEAGERVWSGRVVVDGDSYTVPLMGPRATEDTHRQLGLRLRSSRETGWNASLQVSYYEVSNDLTRVSNAAMDASDGVVPGTLGSSIGAGDGGTGWDTAELQFTYTPSAERGHVLALGAHQNTYSLQSRSYALSNWHDEHSKIGETANYFGDTRVRALYVQDAWQFHPDWRLTAGLRYEWFDAWNGSQFFAGANGNEPVVYPDREMTGTSPKLSLSHALNDEWVLKLSLGRGVRFPTVAELYQGVRLASEIIQNDPDLQAEEGNSAELSAQRIWDSSTLRVSLFQDDTDDAIYSQATVVGNSTVTIRTNIDEVRVRGIETTFSRLDWLWPGVDLQASLTLADPEIVANAVDPASVGKQVPGVPKVRASVLTSWRGEKWSASLGLRHEGRRYMNLDNSDNHPDTYGGSDEFTVADARLGYQVTDSISVQLIGTNLSDEHHYQTHPYAGRTWALELNASFGAN